MSFFLWTGRYGILLGKRDTEEVVYGLFEQRERLNEAGRRMQEASFPWRVWPTVRQGCTSADVGDPHSSVDEGGRW